MFKVIIVLVDVFNNFWNMSHEIYEVYPAYFLCSTGLAWQTTL